jgi:Acetyl-CoA dehydrogenase C-terminal like/Acyl-CoA dehydrogenase, C-terminal domain
MAVGVKSMATLSTGYLNALAYAKERVQGADLAQAANKAAPRVSIMAHPDVRRSLLAQKSHAEGMRALCLYTASIQDQIELAGGHGKQKELDAQNDLLLPLVKGFCSERGFELLTQSLQTYGGSGFVQDYPVEQYLRDQKIDSLYEGTTAIQALDLILRKVGRDGGATLQGFFAKMQATIETGEGGEALREEREALGKALADLQAVYGGLLGKLSESIYHVGLQGVRVLLATAELMVGWLLIRHAAVAIAKQSESANSDDDRSFYQGKVASARYFARNVLPGIGLVKKLVARSTLETMSVAVEAF